MSIGPGDLLRPAEVAVFAGCSVSSIYRLIHKGELGYFNLQTEGGSIRISGIHLEQFLAKHMAEAVLGEPATTGVRS